MPPRTYRHAALLGIAPFLASACSHAPAEHPAVEVVVGPAAPLREPAVESRPQPRPAAASLVVAFDVLVDRGEPVFFARYCEATAVPVAHLPGGTLRAGPFLSAYEAAWLAGLTPHAHTAPSASVPTGHALPGFAIPDEARFLAEHGEVPRLTRATERAAAGLPFVEATLAFASGGEVRPVYASLGGTWRRVAELPWPWLDPYQASSGLAVTGSPRAPVFLEVTGGARGTGYKSESLAAFQLGPGGERRPLGEAMLTEVSDDDGGLHITASRVDLRADPPRLVRHAIEAERLPAAGNTSLKLHRWDDWPPGQPQPELVRLQATVRRDAEPILPARDRP